MGITDKSRQQARLRQQAKNKVDQVASQVKSTTKADVKAKIEALRSQADCIECDTAYQHLMSRIHELSGQL
jgi:hypothetical protein